MTQSFRSGLQAVAAVVVAVLALADLPGCALATASDAAGARLGVQPEVAVTTPASKLVFSATAATSSELAVTWSLQPAGSDAGSIDANGVYTAGRLGTFTVVATSVVDPTRSAAATVQVVLPSSIDSSAFLPAARATRWQPGVTYNGGISTNRSTYTTLSPTGGDDTAAIQAALDACPANQVVKLGPGTYNISGNGLRMKRSDVTLRGSGPDVTLLTKKTIGSLNPVISIGQDSFIWTQPVALTSDAVKGTYSVAVASNPGYHVGEIVHVDEQWDSALVWYHPTFQTTDYLGWGENRFNHSATTAQAQAESRPVGQAMEVAAISGNTLTFTTPFHTAFRVSKSAHIVRIANNAGTLCPDMRRIGVEELAVEYGDGGDGGGNIQVRAPAAYAWIKHVESRYHVGGSVCFHGAFRSELRDSYIHSALEPSPGGAGYLVEVESYASDNLIENNIIWSGNKVLAMRSSGGGNVIGYNYTDDSYGVGYPHQQEVGLNASHMAGSHFELFEGNYGSNFDSDSHWGTQFAITVYRNQLATKRARHAPLDVGHDDYVRPGARTQTNWPSGSPYHLYYEDAWSRRGIGLTIHQRDYNFIGNVIGVPDLALTTSVQSSWSDFAKLIPQSSLTYEILAPGSSALGAWYLGYDGDNPGNAHDPTVLASTLRDGNYDFVTHAQHWHGVGGSGTAQTIPPANWSIPSSLYQTVQPAFMGTLTWPWVDPAAGAIYTLPAKARFDAGTPNTLL